MTWGELAERLADRPGDDILVARVPLFERRVLWARVSVVAVVIAGQVDGQLVGYVAESSSPVYGGIHAALGDRSRAFALLGSIVGEVTR